MWTEFEWENRVNVSTNMSYVSSRLLRHYIQFFADVPASDPRDYLKHVMKSTNMSCLTPEGAMSGDCDFLSANMYARSLFGAFYFSLTVGGSIPVSYISINDTGEDALANLSIEKTEAGIVGHVRIRSKTQGIALSLGDRITMCECPFCISLFYDGC
jgi:coatomer subunit beta